MPQSSESTLIADVLPGGRRPLSEALGELALAALERAGYSVLMHYPAVSPGLNAIEGWWGRLKRRLDETAPTELETGKEFLVRRCRIVHWLNDGAAEEALALAQDQKKRAKEVIHLKGAQ